MNDMPRHAHDRGFSLIELMIAVAIVGILAAIAYPSYTQYVERSRRAEARTILLEAAQFMQRYYAGNDTYANAVLPSGLSKSPAEGTQQYYAISIADGASRTAYTLEAAPQGVMSGDECGTLTIDSSGRRGTDGDITKCWK